MKSLESFATDRATSVLDSLIDRQLQESFINCASPNESSVSLIQGTSLRPEPVSWLWNGWLALGKLHILAGAPGTGKTTLSMAMAAIVSNGSSWPDGTVASSGNVVIWSGEDDPSDTLAPRLIACGAEMARIYFVGETTGRNGSRSFDPARDMHSLETQLRALGNVRLIIVDPIVSAVMGDSHKNTEVRRALQPLVDLAAELKCALVGITHFSKGSGDRDPVERLTGSLAFGALARVVLVAATRRDGTSSVEPGRLLCRAKSNIGSDKGGFSYGIEQSEATVESEVPASYVVWGSLLEGSARELLADANCSAAPAGSGALAEAVEFLTDMLSEAAVPVETIRSAAISAGISWASIKRAKAQLHLEAKKTGMKGGWSWQMPAFSDA